MKKLGDLRRLFHRATIPRPWLLAYLFLIVVPAAIFLYGYYERSAAILKSEVVRTMQQTLKQAGSNLSYRLEHIGDISNAAFMNTNLHSYLSVSADDESISIQMQVIEDLRYIVETVQLNSDVYHMRLFVDKSKLYSGERINFFNLDTVKNEPWFPTIIEADGGIVWTGVYEQYYLDGGNASIFSSARMLRDPQNFAKVSGVLMIDVKENMISDILSELQFAPGTQVFLVDNNGRIMYHPDQSLIGSTIDAALLDVLLEGDEGTRTLKLNSESNDVIYTTLNPTGWKLVVQGTESQLSPQSIRLTQRSDWTSLIEYVALFLTLPFLLLAIIVRGMNRRVNHVITVIRKEGMDSLNDLSPVNGDFHMLERSVDHLIIRVRTLVEETYKAQLYEREAQLQALQAQINPHFLYNTLDTINWIAIGKGATDISQMIDNLAKYFRLSLNKGQNIVSVKDELRLAQVYLEIQQSRFLETFDFKLEIQPDLEAYYMPKLILQPIVENALLHGICKVKNKRGLIVITAKEDNGDLFFGVSDNGIGMEESLARELLTVAPSDSNKGSYGTGSSYGLFNVNERIKLYAGEEYGIHVSSQPGVGTTVTVHLKAELANAVTVKK